MLPLAIALPTGISLLFVMIFLAVAVYYRMYMYKRKVKKLNEMNQSLLQGDSLGHVRVQLQMDQMILEEVIGRGSFAEVFRGRLHGISVAVKRFLLKKGDDNEQLRLLFDQETSILQQLRQYVFCNKYSHTSPNILQYLGSEIKPPHMYLVTEFCELGDLHSLLL